MPAEEIAVIGTGASAFAVVLALGAEIRRGSVRVSLVGPDDGSVAARRGFPPGDPRTWTATQYDELHRTVKARLHKRFPPPRSQFGATLENLLPDAPVSLYRTEAFGGLAEFWSTAMFPLRTQDLDRWGIGYEELEPYYRTLAEHVGIAGNPEDFPGVFPDHFVNRPAVLPTPLAGALVESVREDAGPHFRAFGGANRLAVETRSSEPGACVYCGGCLYGCFKGSLFRPGAALRALVAGREVLHWSSHVHSVSRLASGRLKVEVEGGASRSFDRVFLCAGAIGSSEILLRSLGAADVEVFIGDNEMFNFPIAYRGFQARPFTDHFAISTSVVALEPRPGAPPETSYGHVLITALPGKLLDFYVPKGLWRPGRPVRAQLQGRFLIAQMYVGGGTAARYGLRVDSRGTTRLRMDRYGASDTAGRRQIEALRHSLRGTPFLVPPFPLKRASSSFHYFGGFVPGNPVADLSSTGEVFPGFHVCDSTVLPDSPAQPFTFTLMANAMRVVATAMARSPLQGPQPRSTGAPSESSP